MNLSTIKSYEPLPFLDTLIRSFVLFLPSSESTTFPISLLQKLITSSLIKSPFVVSVNLKFLLYFFSCSLPYFTSSLQTSQLSNGSPPKKSTSRLCLVPDCSIKKSSALLPVSRLIKPFGPSYSPLPAKQYLQAKLQSCATCRHMAFTTPCLFLNCFAVCSNVSSAKSLPSALSASISSKQRSISFSLTSSSFLYFSNIYFFISSFVWLSYIVIISYVASSTECTHPLFWSSIIL